MRTRKEIQEQIDTLKTRLEKYLALEDSMLTGGGVKSYTIGGRSLERYDIPLKTLLEEIARLRREIALLEAELDGVHRSKAAVPMDW